MLARVCTRVVLTLALGSKMILGQHADDALGQGGELVAISKMTVKSRVKTRLAPLLLTIKCGYYMLIKKRRGSTATCRPRPQV